MASRPATFVAAGLAGIDSFDLIDEVEPALSFVSDLLIGAGARQLEHLGGVRVELCGDSISTRRNDLAAQRAPGPAELIDGRGSLALLAREPLKLRLEVQVVELDSSAGTGSE